MSVYAVRHELGAPGPEYREFTDLVWQHIPPTVDNSGNMVPKAGWKEVPKPEQTPEAAKAAIAKAEADKIALAEKTILLAEARKKSLIESVEAKIKLGTQEFDFHNEMKPYLEATGMIKELGEKPMKDIVFALKNLLVK